MRLAKFFFRKRRPSIGYNATKNMMFGVNSRESRNIKNRLNQAIFGPLNDHISAL